MATTGHRSRRREQAGAKNFPGMGFDLVAFFDCLPDMGDPVGAARLVRTALKPDGTWFIVEPATGDRIEDNLIRPWTWCRERECGNQRYLAIPWFAACLTARLWPASSSSATAES